MAYDPLGLFRSLSLSSWVMAIRIESFLLNEGPQTVAAVQEELGEESVGDSYIRDLSDPNIVYCTRASTEFAKVMHLLLKGGLEPTATQQESYPIGTRVPDMPVLEEPRSTPQNRPMVDVSKPANGLPGRSLVSASPWPLTRWTRVFASSSVRT